MAAVLRPKNLALVNYEILKTFNQSWDPQSEGLREKIYNIVL
jgi:hypothetical protein